MKYFIGLFIVSVLSSASPDKKEISTAGMNVNDLSVLISKSFKVGNSKMLGTCLGKEVDLLIDADRVNLENLSASKAENILDAFFKKNPPVSFSYVYQGSPESDLKYYIGSYKAKNKEYLVYMLFTKSKNAGYVINTLQLKQG
jgi:hypothetical protein